MSCSSCRSPAAQCFLSDIRPDEYRFLPFLEIKWPYCADRNVTGGQLHAAEGFT